MAIWMPQLRGDWTSSTKGLKWTFIPKTLKCAGALCES
jgi:hypothetical protein